MNDVDNLLNINSINVNKLAGISLFANSNKFLNQRGEFVAISSLGPIDSIDYNIINNFPLYFHYNNNTI